MLVKELASDYIFFLFTAARSNWKLSWTAVGILCGGIIVVLLLMAIALQIIKSKKNQQLKAAQAEADAHLALLREAAAKNEALRQEYLAMGGGGSDNKSIKTDPNNRSRRRNGSQCSLNTFPMNVTPVIVSTIIELSENTKVSTAFAQQSENVCYAAGRSLHHDLYLPNNELIYTTDAIVLSQ